MGGEATIRSTFTSDGVGVTRAELPGFVVSELRVPAGYVQHVEPDRDYIATVLDGSLEKTFVRGAASLSAGSVLTMPTGATHVTRFGLGPTRVVVVSGRGGDDSQPVPRGFRALRAAGPFGAAWRLARELYAQDDAWPLAAEGLCLDLVAGVMREDRATRASGQRPWLDEVRDRLHEQDGCDRDRLTLTELAEAAGVHPGHLARSFRERFGVSIGEYVRARRLESAATQLTVTDTPVARVAAENGFADQSHLTRAFKRHTGLTPARYRSAMRESARSR